MALFEILHAVKRPTVCKLSAGVSKDAVLAGKLAKVNSSGELELAGNNDAAVVGVFRLKLLFLHISQLVFSAHK